MQEAIATTHMGISHRADTLDSNTSILITITDASWAGGKIARADDKTYTRRSQMGRVVLLADPKIWNGDVANAHIISWKSQLIGRVCRSTMRAETSYIRAAIADMKGSFNLSPDWENEAKMVM